MPDIANTLISSDAYKRSFELGLTRILEHRTAGTFILACANFFQQPELIEKNRGLLEDVYTSIKEHYLDCKSRGEAPADSPDDIAVMERIIQIGLDGLDTVEYRKIETENSYFLLNYNQLRSFRPSRMSTVKNICLDVEFSSDGFHFDKPFLKKEIFAEGELAGKKISLLYNKFPFINYHTILVVDKERHLKQFLQQEYLEYIAELQDHIRQNIPDLVIAYNSLGAGASVNHNHFQAFIESEPLPIFSDTYLHNGGNTPYPVSCHVFLSTQQAWQHIQQLHKNNIAYNLVLKGGRIYCLSRKKPTTSFDGIDIAMYGWSEMAGAFNLSNKDVFRNIDDAKLKETIQAVSYSASE